MILVNRSQRRKLQKQGVAVPKEPKKKAGYFLIIDPQKNTLRISTEDEWLIEQVVKNNANIRKHKTIKELLDEVRDYLKGDGEDEDSK